MWIRLPAATAVTTVTTATAAAAAGTLLGLRHVNADGPTVELGAIEGCDGLVGRIVIIEGDETETTRTTGVAVGNDDGFRDLAVDAKRIAQALVVCIPAQTSNKQLLRHISLFLRER